MMNPDARCRVAHVLHTDAGCDCHHTGQLVGTGPLSPADGVRARRGRANGSGSVRRAMPRPVAANESQRVNEEPAPARRRWARAVVVAERIVVDGGRHPWTVRELDTRDAPGAAAPGCLVFENSEVVRRVWRYPADWVTLPDEDLLSIVQVAR